jgi:hypothetical protein
MARKRIRSQEEIAALAKRLRTRWNPGEPLRPWLRRHAGMLLKLVHGGWSWANIASALEEAGVKYQTEKKWTAAWLQSDFHRARAPLRGYARRMAPASLEVTQVSTTVQPVVRPISSEPAPERAGFSAQAADQSPVERPRPRFKPVSIRPPAARHQPTAEELAEIERNRILTFGR